MTKSIAKSLTGHIQNCQICNSKRLFKIIDMGYFSPCDSLLTTDLLNHPEKTYPLRLFRCEDCGLVQIDYAVNPSELFFPDYPYRSGITDTLRQNLHGISIRVIEKLKIKKNSLVIDIGSNDGTVLEGFKKSGMRVLGIEPTNISKIANNNGINTLQEFFSRESVNEIVQNHGKAALVTASNVFAHVNNIYDLTLGVHDLLEEDGVFISESHYLLDILETLQYDSIYHEHLRYYLIQPLVELFNRCGFTLVDVDRIPNYGGSIRVYAKKGRNHKISENVTELINLEKERHAYSNTTYEKFSEKIQLSRKHLRSLIVRLVDKNKSVVGVGCPGRSATLLHYCGITSDLLPYVAEQSTSLKLDMYTPNTHIPVVDEKRLYDSQPDYVLMLSWHYATPIINTLRKNGLKSKIIIPLPNINIVE